MEKQHVLGIVVGTIGAAWAAMVGYFGLAVSILLVVMLADYITGLLCAFVNKELNSAKGTRGFIKKLIVLILIGLMYLIEGAKFGTAISGEGAAWAYIAIEFISLTENAGKIGVPLGPVAGVIAVLKEKINPK
ncbi:phage holin family protein [Neobacillus sp. MM2021_6]|uniref:phage holin family protein n=1 Tax=Bacillaceae TaxID=186817 RepID=UPI00140A2CFC|nr:MULTISPECIES: phage holin family protein [Bacillaceae]MBO0962937.1 phage holin family protein [Neobacillus sp. MM2021_6]NHC21215.1 phage holin family protein [Bacillus sp. MM2020_4]